MSILYIECCVNFMDFVSYATDVSMENTELTGWHVVRDENVRSVGGYLRQFSQCRACLWIVILRGV